MLVLKRLDDARRDGDRIYAVIRSVGTSSDGKGQAVYAPSAAGQVKALQRAYDQAGIAPSDRRAGRGPRHGHPGRRRDRASGARRGLRHRRGRPLVCARVGQVADRPYQGRRRCRRAHQGGAGPPPQGASPDHKGAKRPIERLWPAGARRFT